MSKNLYSFITSILIISICSCNFFSYANEDKNLINEIQKLDEVNKINESNMKKIAIDKMVNKKKSNDEVIGVTITEAWIKEPIYPNNNSAVYLTINNLDKSDHFLINVYAMGLANNIEIHKSFVDENGIGRMVKIDKITIPAETSVKFLPGGLHIMLFDLKKKLVVGKTYKINFVFDDGKTLSVNAVVRSNMPL